MYLVNMLSFVAAGINLYFLGKFLRALGWYGRKLATLLVGAGWLLVWACFSVLALAHGLSECSGGCGARSPKLLDWVFMLAMAGIGLGFNRLLAVIHSGDPAADPLNGPGS
jgi:predicted metal-binding membrane protein